MTPSESQSTNHFASNRPPMDIIVGACMPAVLILAGIPFALSLSRARGMSVPLWIFGCESAIFVLFIVTAYRLHTTKWIAGIALAWLSLASLGYLRAAPALEALSAVSLDSAQLPLVLLPLAVASNLIAMAIEKGVVPHEVHGLSRSQELKLLAGSISLLVIGMLATVWAPAYLGNHASLLQKLFIYSLFMSGLKLLIFVVASNKVS